MAKKLVIDRDEAVEEILEHLEKEEGFQDFASEHSEDDVDFKEIVEDQLEDMDTEDLEEAYSDTIDPDFEVEIED